jgi:aminomethyltransferase
MTLATQPETLPTDPEKPNSEASPSQLTALLTCTAFAPITEVGWIRITGEDRVRWLNGMVTNSIQGLTAGESNYNFFLSAQGRIQADAVALLLDSSILLGTGRDCVPTLIQLLDRYIIMDDVELAEHLSFGLLIAGPKAAATLATLGMPVDDLAPLHFTAIDFTAIDDWQTHKVALLHAHSPLVPRYELWSESPEAIAALSQALTTAGAIQVDKPSLEQLRLLEGTPLYGTDIRDKELPQETAQTRALHFSKGCYLGQEIVERIRSRGQVHRTFTAFRLEGTLPPPGTLLDLEGKQVGELTSIGTVPLPTGPIQLALGYARREALEISKLRKLPLNYPGGTAVAVASPYPLPAAE